MDPIYYGPYCRDPQNGTPDFGNPHVANCRPEPAENGSPALNPQIKGMFSVRGLGLAAVIQTYIGVT